MSAAALLDDLRRIGVLLLVDGRDLRYGAPRGVMTPERLAALKQHKPELLRLLEVEHEQVRWRIAAMRDQIPPTGTVPIALARPQAKYAPRRTCLHCGDPLQPDRQSACAWCVDAVKRLLNEVRAPATSQRRGCEGPEAFDARADRASVATVKHGDLDTPREPDRDCQS